jgi:succinoglycan biosynthesis protein ExoO
MGPAKSTTIAWIRFDMDEISNALEKVSVIMPTYNSLRTVDRAIDSVLAQTHGEWQLVVVDDASTDATIQRIMERRRGHEEKIVLIRCQENSGPAAARNRGLAMCDGDWIAVLDADDAWRENRLEALLKKARQASADAVCDNLLGFDDHLGKETEPLFARLPTRLGIVVAVAPTYAGTYNLGYLKPIVRRSFVKENHIKYDENLRTGEDLLYLLSLLIHGGRVMCVAVPFYIYTTPVGGTSRKLSQSTKSAPRDADMARSLARLRDDGRANLSEQERHAIDVRISYLQDIAPLAELRFARLQRDWLKVLKLAFRSPAVRLKVLKTIMPRKWLMHSRNP